MLPKNRVSALILTLVFFCGAAAGYALLTYRSLFDGAPLPPTAFLIVAGLLFAVLVVLLSRSELVMGLDEALGFGGSGVARWLVCGSISGFLAALINTRLLPLMKDDSFLRLSVEFAAFLINVYIAYRVAFGKNVFKMFASTPPAAARQPRAQAGTGKGTAWFVILAGLLLLAGMIFLAFTTAGRSTSLSIMALGGACMGLGCVWMGGLLLGWSARRIAAPLAFFMLAVITAGVVLLVVGIVLHG